MGNALCAGNDGPLRALALKKKKKKLCAFGHVSSPSIQVKSVNLHTGKLILGLCTTVMREQIELKENDPISKECNGKCTQYGKDEADKGLGIIPGTNDQIQKQWEEALEGVRSEMKERMGQLQKSTCVGTRVHIVKGAHAAKIPYQVAIQVPAKAEWEIERTQQEMDNAVFGK